MKNAKFSLVALAIVVALASAFTTKVNHKAVAKDQQLFWYDPSFNFDNQNLKSDEITLTGCDGALTVCERGYSQGQLVDQQDPTQGIKPDQQANPVDLIFIHQ